MLLIITIRLIIFSFIILLIGCKESGKNKISTSESLINDTTAEYYSQIIQGKEKASIEKNYNEFGKLITTIAFRVKTQNKEDFEDGIQPWISIDEPQRDLPNLLNKEEVVISENKVTLIIDYPLTNEFRAYINSTNGFTRERLINEISKSYFMLYEEEEKTATIKTVPVKERKGLYNRNETNGKYGIWGHDISDLVLSEIVVYEATDGQIILTLNIES
jgi:hypothetical protein